MMIIIIYQLPSFKYFYWEQFVLVSRVVYVEIVFIKILFELILFPNQSCNRLPITNKALLLLSSKEFGRSGWYTVMLYTVTYRYQL